MDNDKTVTILSSSFVGPQRPSPVPSFRLTVFDVIMSHCPFQKRIIFYRSRLSVPLLQQSLSEVLLHFFPLAGRIHPLDGGQAQLICSDEGVFFSEAFTDATLDDLGDFQPSIFTDRLIQTGDFRATRPWKPETPLLCIQVTSFACGGASVGFAYSHQAADGASIWQFFKSWAEITAGKSLSFLPLVTYDYSRSDSPIFSPQDLGLKFPEQQKDYLFESEDENKTADTVVVSSFNFDKKKIESLRSSLSSSFTSFEIISAHIWHKITQARCLPPTADVEINMLINCRKRLSSLPATYFGNACLAAWTKTFVTEMDSKGLEFAADTVHKTIKSATTDRLQAIANFFEDVFSGKAPFPDFKFPNPLLIAGSHRHPLYEVDFGFGKPLGCSYGMDDWQDGKAYLLPGIGGEGIHATISLFSETMKRLKQDPGFC